MRTRARWSTLVLLVAAVACGDQPTETVPERGGAGGLDPAGTVALATASTDDGLGITTDKDDYQPGDTVHLTGRGWPGGDTLDILLEDDPATHDPLRWAVYTDGDGAFHDSTYVVDEGDLDVRFTLTATSRASGRSLAVTFTDGNLNSIALNPASRTISPTGSASFAINVDMTGNTNVCTVTLSVLPVPALPATVEIGLPDHVVSATNVDFSRTLTLSTDATPPGTYPFTVQAARGTNCNGSGNPTVSGTLIVLGPAAKLIFGQPPTTEAAAATITPAVTVQVADAGNNVIATSTAEITLAIGTNPGGGILTGTVVKNAVNGVATFDDLSIDKQGNNYTLLATSPGLTQVTSVGFNINRGPAAKLAFTAQPSGGSPGGVFPGQPSVAVQDAGGNLINTGTGSGSSITLGIESGTGTSGAALTCDPNPRPAANGIAAFTGCSIGLAGIGYRLRATSGTLTAALSDMFDVTASNQPPSVDAGGPYTMEEGTELTLAPDVGDADADPLTFKWTVVTTGIDASGSCTFVDDTAKNAKLTCTDDSQGAPAGRFSLSLEVSDGVAAAVTDVAEVTVSNAKPGADAAGPYSGNEGSAIALNGSANDPGDNDDAGLTYAWSVNTALCSFDDATKKDAEVTCTDNGNFTLSLVATDDDGGTSGAGTASLAVANADPVADAGGPYGGQEGGIVQLDGSVTDAGAGDTHVWSWEYVSGPDDGGSCTISAPAAEDPTIKCTDDGIVKLTLTATDDDGGVGTDEATLTLTNADPVVGGSSSYSGSEGSPIALTGSFTDAGTNDTHTKAWTYTAGSGVDAGATCSFTPDAAALSPSVTCTDDGTYEVRLTVTDDDGGRGDKAASLTVSNVAPAIATLTTTDDTDLPTTSIVAGTFEFRVPFGDIGANDSHTAALECEANAGFTPLGAVTKPSFDTECTFATIGPKVISVRVTDDDGSSHVRTHSLTVKYDFDGFYAPVNRPDTMNVSKAGQAIPLKWRLTDATGAPVTNLATVIVQAVNLGCSLGDSTDQLEEYAAGASGLQNQGNGYYQFNWKTPAGYASSCKSIKLVFGAGALSYTEGPHAFFSFKK